MISQKSWMLDGTCLMSLESINITMLLQELVNKPLLMITHIDSPKVWALTMLLTPRLSIKKSIALPECLHQLNGPNASKQTLPILIAQLLQTRRESQLPWQSKTHHQLQSQTLRFLSLMMNISRSRFSITPLKIGIAIATFLPSNVMMILMSTRPK